MKIAMIGLGRMGGNMTRRLIQHGHEVVAFDLDPAATKAAEEVGATVVNDLSELRDDLSPPRVAWVMVSAAGTEITIAKLREIFEPGDLVIDGGNSNFRTSIERAEVLQTDGLGFVDVGTSGGIWGLTEGYCLMVGGEKEHVDIAWPIFEALAPAGGLAHVGAAGAGHFTKMVHNGIEYGMMQAYAEGFELLQANSEYDIDLHQVADLWRNGSVVRSWLLDLAERALSEPQEFDKIRGHVEDSGEGRWTVEEGIRTSTPLPVITASLFARFSSRQDESFAAKINAALRNQFGGHAVKSADD